MSLQKLKIFIDSQRIPTKAKNCVVDDAQGSSWPTMLPILSSILPELRLEDSWIVTDRSMGH